MEKVKILAVAPYEGIADIIREAAAERGDIDITVQTGDLYHGKKIAEELANKNYDVIVSRGGTAQLIHAAVETPVIDISVSVYDILRAIKLAENYSGRIAIAGFSGITENARILCDLLQYDIDIFTFGKDDDAVPALKMAAKKGCTLVLCDMTGLTASKQLGMNAILISSGIESVSSAIEEAVKLVHSSSYVHKQKELFQSLLTDGSQEFLIYNPAGSLWFSSMAYDSLNQSLMALITNYLDAFLKIPNQSVSRQIRDQIYTLTSRHLYYAGQKYTAIIISRKNAVFAEESPGFRIYNKSEQNFSDYLNYYGSSNKIGDTAHIIQEYSKSRLPVLIIGESGTGKDKVATLLYENGPFEHAPFYILDCEHMSDRKWNSLIGSENSPLNTLHTTIYFKNPAALSSSQMNKLLHYIAHANLTKNNRLIFSLILNSDQYPETDCVRTELEKQLSCLTVHLLPLRERLADLPSIITLYLHKLNISIGRQIIGFETEAMELMTSFPWPHNLDQLLHVLQELMTITHGSYITRADTMQILEQESPNMSMDLSGIFNSNQTLDEITYQIIRMTLQKENGNREKTAKRLDISRSTLWRILKNHSEQ